MRANLWDRRTNNEALGRSLMVMRRTVQSSIEETPLERHYERKHRTDLTNYLNLSPNVKPNFNSAKPETPTLQARRKHARTGRSLYNSNIQPIRDNNGRGAGIQREHPNPGRKHARDNNAKPHRIKPSVRAEQEEADKGQMHTKVTKTNQPANVLRKVERFRGNTTQRNTHYGRGSKYHNSDRQKR